MRCVQLDATRKYEFTVVITSSLLYLRTQSSSLEADCVTLRDLRRNWF